MGVTNYHRIHKDGRTKKLTPRLRAGDIALINHSDLDTMAARGLIDAGVIAVVNASESISGKYPNRGPLLLAEANIPVLDGIGQKAFDKITDGTRGNLVVDTLRLEDGSCVSGTLLTKQLIQEKMEAAKSNLGAELDLFAENTLAYIRKEKDLLFDPLEIPPLKTNLSGRHALIVVRGEGYKEDLASILLTDYIADVMPVLIAVDGGADALLESNLVPDIIVGDMDSVSDDALKSGAELIVHAYKQGDSRGAPGLQRLQSLQLNPFVLHSAGTSEDVAMLMAEEMGARLIVAVGTHFSLEEFLDKGRAGMASTFLTRLRIGSKLVDAKGLARIRETRKKHTNLITLFVLSIFAPLIATLFFSPLGQIFLKWAGLWFQKYFRWN